MSVSSIAPATERATQVDALRARRDHASAHDRREHGVPTLICASGRGGSGTTMLSALLAVAAAGEGARVLLIDADDHVGPLSMLLGVSVRGGWQDLRAARVAPTDVLTPISTTLTLVAGGPARHSTHDGTALSLAERRACLRRLSVVSHDMELVVIDCGARFDAVCAAITPHLGERLVAVAAGRDPIGLAATFALCKSVQAKDRALPIDVLVNRHEGTDAVRCFDAINAGVRQFLGGTLRLAGAVPTDTTLDTAIRAGMPFLDAAAGSPAAIAAHDIVMRAMAGTTQTRPGI